MKTVFVSSIVVLACAASSVCCHAQGYVSYDYISASTLKDKSGNEWGSGSMQIMSGSYNIPISVKHNDKGEVQAWSVSLYGAYGILDNQGQARELNPDRLFNGSLNVSHIRPISKKWSIIASIGGGIYAPTHEIAFRSILVNGGIIFVHKLNKNLDLGIGAGLTNSYGIPMVLPMLYLKWMKTGRYEFTINMSNGLKVAASTWLSKKIKIELAAIEMDGMSAVTKVEGKSKIYSTVMIKSSISPSYQITPKASIYAGIGGNWARGVSISDRSIKGFANNFKENNGNREFGVSLRVTTGIRYRF
ncbi:hypothetical protein Bache_1407 [Bacteroides helcogenes P 36-108]|uniref:DUF6268 domain-containing protein n=2 Tax=Bacteroides helcogenes TaxID=290053 RepID=E6SV30_BACT6|nr:hypothetical protein Bache_1407 [Bacteroides helcogenes P 36-108]